MVNSFCRNFGISTAHILEKLKNNWRLACNQWYPDLGGNNWLSIHGVSSHDLLLTLAKAHQRHN